jgi:hypothetical protein
MLYKNHGTARNDSGSAALCGAVMLAGVVGVPKWLLAARHPQPIISSSVA